MTPGSDLKGAARKGVHACSDGWPERPVAEASERDTENLEPGAPLRCRRG